MTLQRYDQEDISIFWDYDTTRSSSASGAVSTYDLVKNIRAAIAPFGPIKSFRAYSDFSGFSLPPKAPNTRSELSSSGISLVDCPGDGRKDLSTKIMLVDILINAWDHPPPYTFVIVTGDRDLAYAVSTLRTRKYRVIIIAPTATHLDLTAQASAQLDWSRVVLGMVGGPTDSPELPLPPKEPPRSSYNTRRQSETTNDTQYASEIRKSVSNDRGTARSGPIPSLNPEPPMEDQNGPLRGRRNSLFSSYDARKYSVFGDLDRDYPATNVGIGSFGLGDGPLFPRTRSQGGEQSRADSAPPNIQYSTNPPSPRVSAFPASSSIKGKQKETPIFEPENIFPLIPLEFPQDAPYSGSMFEPFGSSDPFQLSESPPRQAVEKPQATRSTSASSARSDLFSKFSTLHATAEVSTAPTSAQPPSIADKSDLTIKPPSSDKKESPKLTPPKINGSVLLSRRNSETANSATGSATASKIDEFIKKEPKVASPLINELSAKPSQSASTSTKPSVSTPVAKLPTVSSSPVPPASKPPPPKVPAPPAPPAPPERPRANTMSTPTPFASSSTPVPAIFTILAETLRQTHPKGVSRTTLGAALMEKNPKLYKQAGCNKFGKYITAAVAAGVVYETVEQGEACVALHPSFA